MRLFERCILKNEIADVIYHSIDSDQYAYKVGHNSTMALIKCQHTWLKYNTIQYNNLIHILLQNKLQVIEYSILLVIF